MHDFIGTCDNQGPGIHSLSRLSGNTFQLSEDTNVKKKKKKKKKK